MGKLDDLVPPVKKYSCKVRTILSDLDDTDKKILNDALANETRWPAKTLSNALKGRGISIIDVSLTRHREGMCSCSRT